MDRLLPWLKQRRDLPVFVYLHVLDPHSRYEPYRPYDARWASANGHPEVMERLKTLLADWHRYAEAARLPSDEEATGTMSSEELERLRSLGYVQ